MFENSIAVCEQGKLIGKTEEDITAFLGIPFAKAPVGQLRWREPQKPDAWRGIRDARFFRASPLQTGAGADSGEEIAWFSEDCLYLNIWTPARSAEDKLPVFVWYYGGGYQSGRADDPATIGTPLAKDGIIVVTVNYRLNIFGFMCHPDMKKESPYGTGGNFGLLDQIEALRWLNRNIASFGGDKDRITVCGQSAGSASVYNLSVSPYSRDLISGMICESGDVLQRERRTGFEAAAEKGRELAEKMGCASLDEMRALPADRFIRLGYDAMREYTGFSCSPVIDGSVIPYAPDEMLLKNDCARVPVMLGNTSDEGFGRGADYVENTCRMLSIDPAPYMGEDGVRKLARAFWYARTCAWAEKRAAICGQKVWQYLYSATDGARGAQHCAEVPYVFRSLDNDMTYTRLTPPGKRDRELSKTISSYWVNFIKTKDPNGEGLARWESKNDAPARHMRIDFDQYMEDDVKDAETGDLIEACRKWLGTLE